MARRQTLKSLLGFDDSREQIELGLDENILSTPQITAGNYNVVTQSTPRTNSATQLAEALGRYAGPLTRGLQTAYVNNQEKYAELAQGTSTEILKAIKSGDFSPVEDQFQEYSNSLDKANRKRLLNFRENPNNYIRASRVLGTRLSNNLSADLMANRDTYAIKKDEEGNYISAADQITEAANDLIKSNNLEGYSLLAFNEGVAKIRPQHEAAIGLLQNNYAESDQIRQTKEVIVSTAEDGFEASEYTSVSEQWKLLTGFMNNEQQEELLTEIVSDMAVLDIGNATDFINALKENNLTPIGNSKPSDTLLQALDLIVDNQEITNRNHENKLYEGRVADFEQIVNATVQSLNKGESLSVVSFPNTETGEMVEIDLTEVRNVTDFYTTLHEQYVNKTLEDPTEIQRIEVALNEKVQDLETAKGKFYEDIEFDALETSVFDSLASEVDGLNIYGYENSEAIEEAGDALLSELKLEINNIYNDPTKSPSQKEIEARRLVRRGRIDLNKELQTKLNPYNNQEKLNDFYNGQGMGSNDWLVNSLKDHLMTLTKAADDLISTDTPMYTNEQALTTATEVYNTIKEGVENILIAPFTEEEMSLNNPALVKANREAAANNYINQQQAAFEDQYKQPEDTYDYGDDTKKKDEEVQIEVNDSGNYLYDTPSSLTRRDTKSVQERQRYNGQHKMLTKHGEIEQDWKEAGFTSYAHYLAAGKGGFTSTWNTGVNWGHGFGWNTQVSAADRKFYEHTVVKRLYQDKPAMTIDEIREGQFKEAHQNVGQITGVNPENLVYISTEMVANPEDNRDLIKDYMQAIGLEHDTDDKINSFLQNQAKLMQEQFKLNIYNTN